MSELAVRQSDTTMPAKQNHQRSGLPNLDRYLEPERLLKNFGFAIRSTRFPTMRADDPDEAPDARAANLHGHLCAVDAALDRSAPMRTIASVRHELGRALQAKPDRNVVLASVAVLLDSKTRQPANPSVYVNAAAFDLVDEGFPPCVVVAACQRLRREQVFLPEIAEIVAACRAEHVRYRQALDEANAALDQRKTIESYRERLGRMLAEVQG